MHIVLFSQHRLLNNNKNKGGWGVGTEIFCSTLRRVTIKLAAMRRELITTLSTSMVAWCWQDPRRLKQGQRNVLLCCTQEGWDGLKKQKNWELGKLPRL